MDLGYCGAIAADIRAIHYVVVHESGEVDGFDYGREFYKLLVDRSLSMPAAKENERRADAFAASVDAVFHIVAYLRFEAIDLGEKERV